MSEDPKSPPQGGQDEEARKKAELERKRRELEERLKQEQYQRDDM